MNCNRKSASWLTGAKQRGTLYFLENLAYFSERGDIFLIFYIQRLQWPKGRALAAPNKFWGAYFGHNLFLQLTSDLTRSTVPYAWAFLGNKILGMVWGISRVLDSMASCSDLLVWR